MRTRESDNPADKLIERQSKIELPPPLFFPSRGDYSAVFDGITFVLVLLKQLSTGTNVAFVKGSLSSHRYM